MNFRRKVREPANLNERFPKNQWVAYIPTHANGNPSHKDVEIGQVHSCGEHFVFVRFSRGSMKLSPTAQACDKRRLIKLSEIWWNEKNQKYNGRYNIAEF